MKSANLLRHVHLEYLKFMLIMVKKYLITHPENIFVTNTIIVTVDDNGDSIFITPESINTIRQIAEQPTQT